MPRDVAPRRCRRGARTLRKVKYSRRIFTCTARTNGVPASDGSVLWLQGRGGRKREIIINTYIRATRAYLTRVTRYLKKAVPEMSRQTSPAYFTNRGQERTPCKHCRANALLLSYRPRRFCFCFALGTDNNTMEYEATLLVSHE